LRIIARLLRGRGLRMAISPLTSEVDGALGYVAGTYALSSKF
jgi:hypothetical protein